ncbi:type II secretion system protein N [Photobacterium salinisoli]|uniref:type II secretion system protein N n=1 Tax=Photobacterium salinisoli TaxID=1616783 RepID=UPI000EA2B2E4|nr:type II secretion system protein N [Photobacterium salinisoli]
MRYKIFLGLSFALALIVSLLVHLPASWVWQYVPKMPGLSVTGISGTPWQGTASQVRWQQWNLGQVYWELSPWKLLTANAEFAVRLGQGSDLGLRGRGLVGADLGGLYAQNLLLSLPAQQVVQYARLPVPLNLGGNLELTVRDYRFAVPYCQLLEGGLVWSGASIGTPLGDVDPGQVLAELNCNDGQLAANANQASAQVSSEWQAGLTTDQRYNLNGWFKPGAELPSGLQEQLKWLGNPDANGRYPIRYTGRL